MAPISTSYLMVALVQASSNLPAFVLSVFTWAPRRQFSAVTGSCSLDGALWRSHLRC
ncbi:MAG: hypothetical protein EOS00_30030 [Mesorhizobium sp.]|nr:MAG: hypothetical protein EOR81_30325 [Mesorhizobium sp.]RWN53661.1 MAG: hypothetical protein EOS00_30030 [Mesorhizobium sp.]